MLDRHCSVLRIGHQLAGSPGPTAEIFEDLEVMWSGMDDASIGPVDKLADEGEDLVVV